MDHLGLRGFPLVVVLVVLAACAPAASTAASEPPRTVLHWMSLQHHAEPRYQLNVNARGTLGAALVQQGWTGCGPALGTALFFKGQMRIVVVESSLAPGDYPRFSQIVKPGTGCGSGL